MKLSSFTGLPAQSSQRQDSESLKWDTFPSVPQPPIRTCEVSKRIRSGTDGLSTTRSPFGIGGVSG